MSEQIDDALLREAKEQTATLRSLRAMAIFWTVLAVLGLLIWLIGLMSDGGVLA